MPTRSCLLLLLLTAVVAAPVSADPPSVIVSDVRLTPQVLMPGDQGLVSITLTNTASGSVKTESSGSEAGLTVSTSTEINPVIETVTLDGGGRSASSAATGSTGANSGRASRSPSRS